MSRFFLNYLSFYKKQHKKRLNYCNKPQFYTKYLGNYTQGLFLKNNFYFTFNSYVYCEKRLLLPKKFIFFFKKFFKKLLKKKKIKIYIYIPINKFFTQKHKNSRMGKGVGSFYRYSSLKKKNSLIFILVNIDIHRLKILLNFLKKRLPTSLKPVNLLSNKLL